MNQLMKSVGILTYPILLCFIFFMFVGCKPKKEIAPPPPPIPTPVPASGNLIFIQRGHLVKLNLDDSQITPLTSGKSTEWFPACSPKSAEVIYWSNAEGGIYNLWKLNLDDNHRIQLTFDETNSLRTSDQNLLVNDAPSWSSDGKHILYTQDGDIWEMDPDGYNPETLLSGHSALCPDFSPDGKTVIFISNSDDPVYNLFALNLSDRTIKKLTNYTDWNVGSSTFSSDGKKIIFNLYRADATQIFVVNSDGTEPINATNNIHSLCPKFGQGDHKIFYSSYGSDNDTVLNIFVMNSNGTDSKALSTDGGSSPSWSPIRQVALYPTPVGK